MEENNLAQTNIVSSTTHLEKKAFSIQGKVVDILGKKIYPATVKVINGKIESITPIDQSVNEPIDQYFLPGFIDSHVHIESSMLVPSEFAKLAVLHGTVATVSDPHEIANVCGMDGVKFMIDNGKTVNFKFNFGAPSCVPATTFETAGATLDSNDVKQLLQMPEIKYLSEMMNFPGVLYSDEEVIKKIAYALELGKPIDGHAPGLRGETAEKYITVNGQQLIVDSKNNNNEQRATSNVIISTDHECFTVEEALDKLGYGMKIIIREGSAAKNFEALIDLLHNHEDMILFCSDDKHPDSLVVNHINALCARAVAKGIDIFKVLKAACVNPVLHYKLDVGLLKVGDPADFIVCKDLVNFNVLETYINGEQVMKNGESFIKTSPTTAINYFNCDKIAVEQLKLNPAYFNNENKLPVIEVLDGQLITNKIEIDLAEVLKENQIESNTNIDVLKMVVVNRYNNAPIAFGLVKNIGLKQGALASSVAHDSHNIVAVGVDDASLCEAINLVIEAKGGISVSYYAEGWQNSVLPLPVAGLMSLEDGEKVAADYTKIDNLSKQVLGSTLGSPFMSLSFLALLVIPHIKLSDKGLFDGDSFNFITKV